MKNVIFILHLRWLLMIVWELKTLEENWTCRQRPLPRVPADSLCWFDLTSCLVGLQVLDLFCFLTFLLKSQTSFKHQFVSPGKSGRCCGHMYPPVPSATKASQLLYCLSLGLLGVLSLLAWSFSAWLLIVIPYIFLSLFIFTLCVYVNVCMYVGTPCTCLVPMEASRLNWIYWNWSYRRLQAIIRVLGIKPLAFV